MQTDNIDNELLVSLVDLLLYGEFSNKNLVEMYRIMGHEKFILFCKRFSERSIELPNYEEVKDTFFTVSLYYYKYIENLSWKEIKEKVGVDFNTLRYEAKINKILEYINRELVK